VQVGRRGQLEDDAKVMAAVHHAVGHVVTLRADANRLWTLEEACRFAACLQASQTPLEYLEEPVSDPGLDLAAFVARTGIPVAADESLDARLVGPWHDHGRTDSRVDATDLAALVIKPSVIGSLENTAVLLRWARAKGLRCVISSAFETSAGLASLAAIALAADRHAASVSNATQQPSTAHGLATLAWLADDTVHPRLEAQLLGGTASSPSPVGLSVDAIAEVERQLRTAAAQVKAGSNGAAACCQPFVQRDTFHVKGPSGAQLRVQLTQTSAHIVAEVAASRCVLLLHGFLGCSSDWEPVAGALAEAGYTCVSMDLPGHGGSLRDDDQPWPDAGVPATLAQLADVVRAAIAHLGWSDCVLVGYSLGARVAMTLAAEGCHAVGHVIAVSGSPGLQDENHQGVRLQQDKETAAAMRATPQAQFVEQWYQGPLWTSLRELPGFSELVRRRGNGGCWPTLAGIVEGCSPGMQNLWPWLGKPCSEQGLQLSFVVGALDGKFCGMARRIAGLTEPTSGAAAVDDHLGCRVWQTESEYNIVEVMHAGHAVHVEQPVALANALLYLLRHE
jgi:isochorismate synthase / 2-succinyl-5-enolpyruvyl-6-hydroxy-3-cyclohexene-1-carboxylate synthase / 2-succinyl-6-hydroxy-2,4-cyclohexadiene-1-carboxylate synthase / o-succinylbenzoate synthase